MIDEARDTLDELRDTDAVRRYLGENRSRVIPIAIAVLLLVAGAAFAVSTITEDYDQSLQLDVDQASEDPSLSRVDSDEDGLSDLQEIYRFGTDPNDPDTDGDGIPDDWEARHRIYDDVSNRYKINPLVNDSGADPDGDGLSNLEEFECGSDPTAADADGDGLPDPFECKFGLDPNSPNEGDTDEDGDGLSLEQEAKFGTDPTSADTDGDGLPDPREVRELATDPTRYSTAGHGISDGWLVEYGLNATDEGVAFLDPDDDGLSNRKEFRTSRERFNPAGRDDVREQYGTWLDPAANDTDGDGMGDGWEVTHGLDPLDPSDADADFDDDGLTNPEEFAAGSDPRAQDTDEDGLSDPEEVREGWTVEVDGTEKRVFSDPAKADSDEDFLPDPAERQGVGTVGGTRTEFCPDGPCPLDPLSPDTDLDGLSDSFEVSFDIDPRLDPTLPDTDGDGVLDKAEFDLWSRIRDTASDDTVTRVRGQGDLVSCGGVEADTISGVRSALGPSGDVDGDGKDNLVDSDSDCDGLGDGDEVDPPRKEAQPGSQDTRELPRTNPALADTDGDGLPDNWENKFTRYNYGLADWNLNASDEDSLDKNDGKTDADRDLDGDGVQYESGYAQPRSYTHSNIEEFKAGTNPNEADSDEDGLPDGWEVFFDRLALSQNADVQLDPLDPDDADVISKEHEYVRFAEEGTADAELDESNNETKEPVSGTDVVKISGRYDVRYVDEFDAKTDPTVADTDGDGLPDAWELYYLSESESSAHFDPTDPGGASRDFDGDGLTNLEEFEAGTSPIQEDTDLGGIPDGKEVSGKAGADPLNTKDDDPNGDIDDDGYSNVCELRPTSDKCDGPAPPSPTDPVVFDTDGDGVLDGPDRSGDTLSASSIRAFRDAGVVSEDRSGTTVFLGEADRSPSTDPTDPDSNGDGLPDGWTAFHVARRGLDPSETRNDDDALSDVDEYEVGLPETWSVEDDGSWWFGPDPTNADSDGDGALDGVVDTDAGVLRGEDYDLDNDGLNDFTGEDPHPFYDFDNDGAEDPRDPDLVRSWVWDEGRQDLNTTAVAPENVTVAEQTVQPTVDATVEYPVEEKTIRKGGLVFVNGTVTVNGTAVPDVPVLANLYDGSGLEARGVPGRVLDVAFTDADGSFSMEATLAPDRTTNVTAGDTLFGTRYESDSTRSWSVNTSAHPPGFDYRVVAWSYGISPVQGDERGYDYETTVDGETVHAPGVESTFTDPYVHGDPVTVRSGSQWNAPDRFDLKNGGTLSGSVTLVDSVGDPLADQDVRLEFRNRTITGTTDDAGTFTFETDTDPFDAPGVRQMKLAYDGTDLVDGTETTVPVRVRFPASIEGSVADPSLTAVAGESLPVEGNVEDTRGEPVADAPVTVSFAGVTVETNTSEDGRFAASVPVPTDAPVGNRKVVTRFTGTDTHIADRTEVGIVQIRQVAQVNLAVDDASLGEPVEVEGELRDLAGRTVRDPTMDRALRVDLTVGNTTVTSRVDNDTATFGAVIPADAVPEPGNVSLVATFEGSSLYEASERTRPLFVTSSTEILLPNRKVTRGETAQLRGQLVDARDQPIPDADVHVLFRSESLGNVTTDDEGRFVAEVDLADDFPLGTALVEARYEAPENGTLRSAAPTQTFYRVRAPTDLDMTSRTVPTGPIPVNGTLRDGQDRAVVGGAVDVRFGDRSTTVFTDFSGRFEAVFDGTDMDPRNVSVTAEYAGADRFAPASRNVEYQVVADTELSITRTAALVRGDIAPVEGTLTTATGVPVSGATVEVLINGSVVTETRTDLQGEFNAEPAVPADLPTGPTTLTIRYPGDANHDPSIRRIDATVKARPNIEVIVPDDLEVGDEFTGKVRVVDDQGRPISNSEVQVKLSSLRYPFTLKTNETGWAEFPGRIQSAGSANVDVRFTGSATTVSSTSETQIVASEGTLARGGPPVAAAGVALLLLAAAVVGYLRWRRGVVEEAEEILQEAETQLAAGNEYSAVIMQTYRALADLVQRETELEDRPELTASEFADAIEDTLPVDEDNLRELVEIFEEARYSFHQVGPAQRDRAVANFRAIQRDLAEGTNFVTAPDDAEGGEPA